MLLKCVATWSTWPIGQNSKFLYTKTYFLEISVKKRFLEIDLSFLIIALLSMMTLNIASGLTYLKKKYPRQPELSRTKLQYE